MSFPECMVFPSWGLGGLMLWVRYAMVGLKPYLARRLEALMTTDRSANYIASLMHELCALPQETEWVEFKCDKANPQEIGEYISALANSAALVGKAFAYLVWGVRNEDHAKVGTVFDPHAVRVGNEELESWWPTRSFTRTFSSPAPGR